MLFEGRESFETYLKLNGLHLHTLDLEIPNVHLVLDWPALEDLFESNFLESLILYLILIIDTIVRIKVLQNINFL